MTPIPEILNRLNFAGLTLFLIFSPFSISLTTLALAVGLPAWMLTHWIHKTWKEVEAPLAVPFLLFFAASIAAIVTAEDPAASWSQAKKFGEPLIFFWALGSLPVLTPKAFFTSAADWLEARGPWSRPLAYGFRKLAGLDTLEYVFSVLILAAAVSGLVGCYQRIFAPEIYGPRARGPFGSVNTYAQMMMLSAILLFGRILFARERRAWWFVALACIGGGLVVPLSRGAWLGFLAGAGFLLGVKSRRLLLGTVSALILAAVLLPGSVQRDLLRYQLDAERNLFLFDQSMKDRVAIWRAALEVFKDHPWTGCGFRCGVVIAGKYPEHDALIRFAAQHSNILQLMMETGILGLAAWLTIWVFYFKHAFARFGEVRADPSGYWARLGGMAAVLGFHTNGLVESNYFDSEVAMLTFFLMALSLARPRRESPDNR